MPRRALRRRRSPSPVSSEASSKRGRSSSPESVAEERFAPLRAGDIACVPVREDGETSMSLALVTEAPGSGSGMGLLLEAKEDLHRDGCVDPRVERRGGLSEDQSKSSDLAHSNSEATLGRPPMHIRERIGPSGFDVNMHIIEKII